MPAPNADRWPRDARGRPHAPPAPPVDFAKMIASWGGPRRGGHWAIAAYPSPSFDGVPYFLDDEKG